MRYINSRFTLHYIYISRHLPRAGPHANCCCSVCIPVRRLALRQVDASPDVHVRAGCVGMRRRNRGLCRPRGVTMQRSSWRSIHERSCDSFPTYASRTTSICPNSITSILLKTCLKPGLRHVLSRSPTCRRQVRDQKKSGTWSPTR